jgi:thiosulfate/3-mercaptopyruvate sulfurtransferase
MPGAVNLPFTEVQMNGRMKSPEQLQVLFEKYGRRKLIFSCGTGVTACIVALAAEQAGLGNLALYDGSWTEWGSLNSGRPVTQ